MSRLWQHNSKKLSRRALLSGGAGLIAVGAGAGLIGLPKAVRADDGPKRGGHFRCGVTGASNSDSLDPAAASSAFTSMTSFAIGNGLVEMDHESKLVPELAGEWDASSDFATWTFKLRRGIEFHDGKTMTADDVVYSLNRHRGPDSKSAMASLMKPVTDVKATGKNEFVITLDSGNADFPYVFAGQHATIMPEGTEDFLAAVRTGAYMVERFDPGIGLYLTRNPNYWKDGRGNFDRVDLLGVNDVAARTSALRSGELDAMDRVDTKLVGRLTESGGVDIVNQTGFRHCTMPMRVDMAPFDNADVRLAIKYAIDREDILKRVLKGYGTIGNDHPVSSIQNFHADDLPQRSYDPDKSRFHLGKAGLDAVKVDLSVADAAFAGAVDAAVLFKDSAAKCGIDINVVREPEDGYWKRVWLKAPWCVAYWSGRPTADWILTLGYTSGANWNESHWKSESFDKLLVNARVEKDDAKRAEMYAELQRLVADESGQLVPFFMNHVYARSNKVRAGNEAGNYPMDGYRCVERWWFA